MRPPYTPIFVKRDSHYAVVGVLGAVGVGFNHALSCAGLCVFLRFILRRGPGNLVSASTSAERQVPSRHAWRNVTSLSSTPQRAG